ncbi:MAG TPA: segregation/condensation protein A [Nitrospiria bacterium]
MMEESQTPYAVKIPSFEGPMDLLLHLIKKSEINIHEIPISLITHQYLEYLGLMKSLNLSVAGEFLVMAATLIHIKSKTLLPPAETDGEDEEDPRADLVMRLLEYQRFKDAAQGLEVREQEWREIFSRTSSIGQDMPSDQINVIDLNLFDLMDALRGVLDRAPENKGIELVVDELSVQDRMEMILEILEPQESVAFLALFENDGTRSAVIVTFLALLELVRLRQVRVIQTELFGAIRIWKIANSTPS